MLRVRRKRPYFVAGAAALAVVVVLGTVGLVAALVTRGHRPDILGSARAQAIFEMPYTKGIGTARFHEVLRAEGSSMSGSGVIEFAPKHAFSETWNHAAGENGFHEPGYRAVDVGGVAYEESIPGSRYRATGYDGLADIQFLGWDGGPPAPGPLQIAGQIRLEGRQAWVLKNLYSSDEWVVAERSGDPLEAVLDDGHDTYRFSDWGRPRAPRAPVAAQVSTARYSGSGTGPAVAPAATVTVLKERPAPAAGAPIVPGFRSIALEISYQNTTSAPARFDNILTLVSPGGVSALAFTVQLTPSLQETTVAPGHTITGWDAFTVPRRTTHFHLLLSDQTDQQSPRYLISIPVRTPG